MQGFENKRHEFELILDKYKGYCELYKLMNRGSLEGVTHFEDFYRMWTYFSNKEGHSSGI